MALSRDWDLDVSTVGKSVLPNWFKALDYVIEHWRRFRYGDVTVKMHYARHLDKRDSWERVDGTNPGAISELKLMAQ